MRTSSSRRWPRSLAAVVQIQGDKVMEIFTDKFINQPLYPVPAWDKRS